MWSSRRSDRRVPDHAILTITAGACDPAGAYLVEYLDADLEDWTTVSISPNGTSTVNVTGASRVIIQSGISTGADDQAWTLAGDLISGRGAYCSFVSVDGECGLFLTREEMGGIVANTISVSGSLSGKTAADFTIED